MALKILNTLSRKIELFKPLKDGFVGLYTCGPTVYNYPHIGNWRAYVFADILKRYLIYKDFEVKHIMNITDVEDKIIKEVSKRDIKLKELTEFYTNKFFIERDELNILPPNKYTKATEYIEEMTDIIQNLLDKGFAYKSEDGSIYFDIKKFKDYGKLSHFKFDNLKENAKGRLNSDEYDKENARDFALWKSWSGEDGNVFWDTNLGKGRPGWHIECSAMSISELGESFDIHTGGVDNIFPHHENEIAQSECFTGKNFVKYFMHNEHLLVDGKKMSKSLGNFYTLNDLEEKGIDPLDFRYWLLGSNYHKKINFTLDSVLGSKHSLSKIRDFINSTSLNGKINKRYQEKFIECMDDNLNTPKAVALIWELLKDKNVANEDKKETLLNFDKVFGLNLNIIKNEEIPEEILKLAKERLTARIKKDWAKSDEIREKIKSLGYEIKDLENDFKIKKSII